MKYQIFSRDLEDGKGLVKGTQLRIDLYNNTSLNEVEELKGLTYKEFNQGHTDAERVVKYIEITGTQSNKDYSASIEFNTANSFKDYHEHEVDKYNENERFLEVFITLKGKDEEKTENLYWELAEMMEKELNYYEVEYWRCPSSDQIDKDRYEYKDGFQIKYEHGNMTEIKDTIKDSFKEAKKKLGIR